MIATIKVGARLYKENNFDCYVWPIESENSKPDLVFTCEQLPHSSTFICTAPGFGTPEAFGRGPLRVHKDSLVEFADKHFEHDTKHARKIEVKIPVETPYIKPEDFLWKNTTPANEKGGVKFDDEKPDWSLLPLEAVEDVVRVYDEGVKKYGRDNWKKGLKYSRIYSAMQRHLKAWWEKKEEIDQESGNKHLAKATWACLTLIEYSRTNEFTHFDDRPRPWNGGIILPPEVAATLIKKIEDSACDHTWVYSTSYGDTAGVHTKYHCNKCGNYKVEDEPPQHTNYA